MLVVKANEALQHGNAQLPQYSSEAVATATPQTGVMTQEPKKSVMANP